MESENAKYLKGDVTFTNDGRLLDYKGDSVMMDWEDDIMKDAAALICRDGGKILNVGFGLGLIDNYIQSYNPKEHWIIEAHPQVIDKMKEEGWDKKSNVTCIFDKWQNVINNLPKFDGIYFDTWAEIGNFLTNQTLNLLTPGGKLLFFGGKQNSNNVAKRMGLIVEDHITILKKVDKNQRANDTLYFKPRKEYYHQLLIKQ